MGAFAATAAIRRRVVARCPIPAIRAAALPRAIRSLATSIVIAALESGRAAPRRVTTLAGIATTLEPATLARFIATGIASIAEIVPATGESTTGIATIGSAARAGLAAGAESAPRVVAPLSGITPTFEAAAFTGALGALESAPIARSASACGTATIRGLVAPLETTALGCVAAAPEATGVTTPVAGVLTLEPAALARSAALVGTATVAAAVEPTGTLASLVTASVGRIVAGATRVTAATEAPAFPRVTATVEPAAAPARILLVVISPAGPGVGSAAPEGLPIVILFRHGAPFLGIAKVCIPRIQSRTRRGARGTASSPEHRLVLKRR
ncbi:hypothetical protein NG2371_06698 [Nocardia gamkensis]|uniref:Uncharacterized protein n=1 Tax=Nocardia gamkensis TaxID=352869 RepID=A0A7X6R762_9NOCA|nr:hypothetical protein [Nocardia gamkensis]NKY31121.1 hypothetical protein [Nocardia gamkensis]NQE72213.1 hypothetical protein [Nocardia gamkensis]